MNNIRKQIRGDEFDVIPRMQRCKTMDELTSTLLGYIPKDVETEYNYVVEKICATPSSIRFDVYAHIMKNTDTQFILNLTPLYIASAVGVSEEIVKKSLNMLVNSGYIIELKFEKEDNYFYYRIPEME